MRRLLLATIVAVVVATPISAAWGSSSSSPAPAAKIELRKDGTGEGTRAPNANSGPHGDGQCPFADTSAI
jgi:hypothetical protein